MYAKKYVVAWQLDIDTTFNQAVLVKIKNGNENIGLSVVYRSPNSSRVNDEALCNWMAGLTGTNVLIGDFNYPDIDWENGTSGARSREFYETTADMFMEQLVTEPTHVSGHTLDLILSNREGLIREVKTEGRIGKSDHDIVTFEMAINEKNEKEKRVRPNYKRANFIEMRATLDKNDWRGLMRDMNVNEAWEVMRDKVKAVMQTHIPMKKPRKNNEPPWFNREIQKKIEEKRKAWRKWKGTGRSQEKEEYKKKVTELKKKIRNRKNEVERNIMKNRKTNPKLYYSHLNRAKVTKNKIGPLVHDDVVVVEPREQARILNEYYASVFTRTDGEVPEVRQRGGGVEGGGGGGVLEEILVTENCVGEAIDGLKEDSAAGPDEIPPRVIKELKHQLITPITIIFQKSIKESRIPDDWRLANVTPIFKKGKKSEPGNYRPVSLTNVIGKMMERIVKKHLVNHIERNNLLSNSQHGFRTGRSVQTNLIEFFDVTTKWWDEGKSFDVLYLDFSKAFDKVCHARLVVKLQEFGVTGEVLEWLKDWLRGRKQRVRVEGEFSDWVDVISSVVQGSVLGGILFDLFIDDIDDETIQAFLRKFADDTKVAKLIESLKDAEEMQRMINRLAEWANRWGMAFNVKKCKVLHFGRKNPKQRYVMNGIEIMEANEEKDLGVWTENTMKPTKQCAAAAKAANFALGQLQRAFHYRKKDFVIPLYKTFVRPKIECAAAAWCPWTEADVKTVEKVQERMIRSLSDVKGSSYEEKLQDVGLTTLRERRRRGDVIEVFKTMKGFNRVEKESWFTEVGEEARPTRSTVNITEEGEVRKEHVLKVERARLEVRRNFFTVRAAKSWNELPDGTKKVTSINSFKNSYDKWRKNTPEAAGGEENAE